jgi:hypothetical protein
MKKQLVLLGGGHAHLLRLADIHVFINNYWPVRSCLRGFLRLKRALLWSPEVGNIAQHRADVTFPESGPLAKVGIYSVGQIPVLSRNLMNRLEGRSLEKCRPGGEYLRLAASRRQ